MRASEFTVPEIGINVRSDGDIDYADLIVDGKKKLETRNSDSLRPYVGKRVSIVKTGKGRAYAIGVATVGEPIEADEEQFRKLEKEHLVPAGSKFDIQPGSSKFLYPMLNPKRYERPREVGHGIVSRKVFVEADTEQFTFNQPRHMLNIPELIKRGAIFVTHPHGPDGWETDRPDWDFSLITLQNVLQKSPDWVVDYKKYITKDKKLTQNFINKLSDQKYQQILWSIQKLGIPDNVAFLDKQGVAEGGAETSWSDGTEKITLQDILELTKHIKQINLPIDNNLKSKLIHWDGNPEEIERINQVTVSNQFPILVMLDGQGQIDWILDGNHRLHKAIKSQAKTIPAKLIKPSDLDDKAKRVFHIKEQDSGNEGINGIPAWRIRFRRFKDMPSYMPEREGKVYLMPTDHSALRTFGNLTGKDDEKITQMPTEAYLVSGDAMVGDMSIINAISKETKTTNNQDRIEQLKKLYLNYRVPYSQYKPGMYKYPEILADPSQLQKLDKAVVYDRNTGEIVIKDKKAFLDKQGVAEASGYIPSNAQKNDPRFKTALTVDVKPDSIKKNAKAFNSKVSRAGIPPKLNTNGKF